MHSYESHAFDFTPLLLESNLLPGMFSFLLLHSLHSNEALLLLLPSPHSPSALTWCLSWLPKPLLTFITASCATSDQLLVFLSVF